MTNIASTDGNRPAFNAALRAGVSCLALGMIAISSPAAAAGLGQADTTAIPQTTGQAAKAIEAKLSSGFVREPHVTVEVDTYRPFYILGEVTTSGQYPFVNGMTVETAVAIAAGFGPRAARDYAVLTRDTGGGLVSGIVPMTYPVRPGDTIVIKERFF